LDSAYAPANRFLRQLDEELGKDGVDLKFNRKLLPAPDRPDGIDRQLPSPPTPTDTNLRCELSIAGQWDGSCLGLWIDVCGRRLAQSSHPQPVRTAEVRATKQKHQTQEQPTHGVVETNANLEPLGAAQLPTLRKVKWVRSARRRPAAARNICAATHANARISLERSERTDSFALARCVHSPRDRCKRASRRNIHI
jgi:hypothetical protein